MAPVIWAVLSTVAMLVLLCLMLARQRLADARLWPAWRTALSGDEALACVRFRHDVSEHLAGVGRTIQLARAECAAGDEHMAGRMLRVAAQSALRLVHKLDGLLCAWRDAARVLRAIQPVAPPLPSSFRDWTLRGYAVAVRVLDHVLVTSGERFRARVAVLRRALSRVRRSFTRVALAARSRKHAFTRTVRSADDAHADLGALAAACAGTLEALAVSRQSLHNAHTRDASQGVPASP